MWDLLIIVSKFQLEEAFRKQQQAEEAARLAERERVEKERVEARKRKEVQRITDVGFSILSCLSHMNTTFFLLC